MRRGGVGKEPKQRERRALFDPGMWRTTWCESEFSSSLPIIAHAACFSTLISRLLLATCRSSNGFYILEICYVEWAWLPAEKEFSSFPLPNTHSTLHVYMHIILYKHVIWNHEYVIFFAYLHTYLWTEQSKTWNIHAFFKYILTPHFQMNPNMSGVNKNWKFIHWRNWKWIVMLIYFCKDKPSMI